MNYLSQNYTRIKKIKIHNTVTAAHLGSQSASHCYQLNNDLLLFSSMNTSLLRPFISKCFIGWFHLGQATVKVEATSSSHQKICNDSLKFTAVNVSM